MWESRKQGRTGAAAPPSGQITTKGRGDLAEQQARRYLEGRGLRWLASNFRTPGRGGGEIDLVMREPDGTLVFVEVRGRSGSAHGGAGASIGGVKQRRIVFAARHYLLRVHPLPPCRFDVVLIDGDALQWIRGAFDAS